MGLEVDDGKKAVDEAMLFLQETRQVAISVPLGVIYDAGCFLSGVSGRKERLGNKNIPEVETVDKIEKVIPPDLISEGRNKFKGNLEQQVGLSISYKELSNFGVQLLMITSGEDASRYLFRPKPHELVEQDKTRWMQSFLIIYQAFVGQNGISNDGLASQVQNKMGQIKLPPSQ